MFNIFKKPAKLEVHAYTHWHPAHHFTPIVKAHQTLPQWWCDLPVEPRDSRGFHVLKKRNMKTCVGLIDLYKRGIMLEYWNDVVITVTKTGWSQAFQYEPPPGKDISHPAFQWGSGFPGHHHIKLTSPWIIQEDTATPFLFCPATWSHEQIDGPKIVPGIVNFKYQGQVNVNMFLPIRDQPYDIRIRRGTPLVQLIPLSDKPLELHNHLITPEEHQLLDLKFNPSRCGVYSERRRLLDRIVRRQQEEKKCPFSWLRRPPQ